MYLKPETSGDAERAEVRFVCDPLGDELLLNGPGEGGGGDPGAVSLLSVICVGQDASCCDRELGEEEVAGSGDEGVVDEETEDDRVVDLDVPGHSWVDAFVQRSQVTCVVRSELANAVGCDRSERGLVKIEVGVDPVTMNRSGEELGDLIWCYRMIAGKLVEKCLDGWTGVLVCADERDSVPFKQTDSFPVCRRVRIHEPLVPVWHGWNNVRSRLAEQVGVAADPPGGIVVEVHSSKMAKKKRSETTLVIPDRLHTLEFFNKP